MKKIKLIATGGTISARGKDRLDLKDYQSGHYTGKDFIKHIPEISDIANVDVVQLSNFSSTSILTKHWVELRNLTEEALNESDYDGVVITHGTNTLEETAYFLHLTVNSEKPVVCVGAQRPFTALSSDIGTNLIAAVRVAADSASCGNGVLVVMNDEINCAREVSKTSTYRLETFQSGMLGFLGYVDPDQTVQFYRSPQRRHTMNSRFAKLSLEKLASVEIVYSYAGANSNLIRYISNSGKYDGIVVAGTGAGRCSAEEGRALKEAVENGLIVVRSSRVGDGRVVPIESFQEFSCVTADNLNPQKARILLMLSLSISKDVSNIQRVFDEH
jgi:L-asparaginase